MVEMRDRSVNAGVGGVGVVCGSGSVTPLSGCAGSPVCRGVFGLLWPSGGCSGMVVRDARLAMCLSRASLGCGSRDKLPAQTSPVSLLQAWSIVLILDYWRQLVRCVVGGPFQGKF